MFFSLERADSLQDAGSGYVSVAQKSPRAQETHVGFSGRVIDSCFLVFKSLISSFLVFFTMTNITSALVTPEVGAPRATK